ncbi:MAG: NUDIX hydrolase [Cetobacterium sp.]
MDHRKCGCKIITWKYTGKPFGLFKEHKRAGGVIIHRKKKQVLLVQSRGVFWGFPKGSVEEGETLLECAKREILEETSIDLDDLDLSIEAQDFFIYHNRTHYYMKIVDEKPRIDIKKIKSIKFNDCTGIAWVDLDCLTDNLTDKTKMDSKLRLNHSAKEIISRISNPSSKFYLKKFHL